MYAAGAIPEQVRLGMLGRERLGVEGLGIMGRGELGREKLEVGEMGREILPMVQ